MLDSETKANRNHKDSNSASLGNSSAARWDTPSSPQGACHPFFKGDFPTTCSYKDIPKNFNLLKRANWLRKAGYLHEMMLWKKLKGKQMCELNFNRQQVIGNYIADFVCYKIHLIIEVDGASHKGKEEYDMNRDIYLKNCGFNILHIPVIEIFQNADKVAMKIKAYIEALPLFQRGACAAGGVS